MNDDAEGDVFVLVAVVVPPADSEDAAMLDVRRELFTVLNVDEYLNLEAVAVVVLVVDGTLPPPSCCFNSCCFCNIFLAVIIIFNARIWRLV